ncbi:exodeoxyribonuclease VII large subunit, partial [bacterium]|nr:exodeoxyribonuclease VII large subunit [bacterium]
MSQLVFEDFLAEENFYSVVELTRDIKQLLESNYSSVWVQGEISNFTHHVSGHMYFSLKDEQAQISCVMWQSRNQGLYFTPQDGMKATINGRLSVFEKRGTYQLTVWELLDRKS